MAIQPIGYQPNFTGKAATYKGNEYEKTNNGKLIGTGAGVVLSGIMGTRTIRNTSNEAGIAKLKNSYEKLKNKSSFKFKSFDDYLKFSKKVAKGFVAFMTVLTIGLGLGIGAIVDNNKNNNRAYKADMDAKKAAAETKEAPKA